ncbi:MAG: twin-arginine translocase subunit TatB [Sphingomonas sp.]|uniref:Sec-independent protein translocase protein TatB n=1 Tax=Sphingomonas sp. TaxID=28214 RepID=UPI001B06B17F|nr:Sec-independent protein translocase protein TatB [Sphingomonas sp.]MBO9624613.1 twin-arginine translocase subunit TatB [Sphingomonas sp.]
MLDFNAPEFLVVAIVALVVIGPKDLPKAMHFLGKWVGKARGVARQFRSGFDNMVREAELAEMEKQWAAENARIMAEHPPVQLPAPEAQSDHMATSEDAPVMVEQPTILPEAEIGVAPAPVAVEKPKRTRAPKAAAAAAEAPAKPRRPRKKAESSTEAAE